MGISSGKILDMALSVIGAGFGRTGTLSVSLALEQLGFGPCYHMDNVFRSAAELAKWQPIAAGDAPDWDQVFNGFVSTVDWPGTTYWKELASAFPGAKILLTVRPAESWWASFSQTIRKLIQKRESFDDVHKRGVLGYANKIIAEQTFGGDMDDKAAVIQVYEQRIDDVKNTVPADRLLVFDVRDGWDPLCHFLGVPVPQANFPNTNNAEDFWQHFGSGLT